MAERTQMENSLYEIGRRVKHVRDNLSDRKSFLKWADELGMDEKTAYRLIEVSENMRISSSYKPSDKEVLELMFGWGGR